MPHPRFRRALLATLALASTFTFASAGPAAAQTFTVTPTFTLAQAVAAANANPGNDVITFDPAVTSVAVGATVTITDPVVIDACRHVDDDPATFDTGVQVSGGNPQFIVDAPDVTMQGFHFGGSTTAIEVTPDGDRFRVRGSHFVQHTIAAVHVDRAEDVTIGGVAPAPCSGQTGASVGLSLNTGGIVLDQAERATVDRVVSLLTLGPTVIAYGGRGLTISNSQLDEALGAGRDGSVVEVSGSGTVEAPFRIVDTGIGQCLDDCVHIRDGSVFDIGASDPANPMTIRRMYEGYGTALVRISESSGTLHDTRLPFGDGPGLLIDDGAHDVLVERVEISSGASHGVVIDGPLPPTNIVLRDSYVGYRFADDGTGTIRPVGFPNRGSGIVVRAGQGVVIGGEGADDGNLIAANVGSGIEIAGGSGIRVIGNRIGSDPTHEGVPTNGFNVRHQVLGVAVAAPGTEVRDNVIGAATTHGVHVRAAATGAQVVGNRIGTNAAGTAATAPNGADGVRVEAPHVVVADNVIGGNTDAGVFVDVTAPGATVRGNRIGIGTGGESIPNLRAGIDVRSTDNVVGALDGDPTAANLVSGAPQADTAVVVTGQRTTVRGNSIFANAGNGIDLWQGANGGVQPPQPSLAEARGALLTVRGWLGPQALPGITGWRVDVYASRACGLGDLEGERYLGSITPTADANFDGTVPTPPGGLDQLTFTVAAPDGGTSEFTGCWPFLRLPPVDPPATTSTSTLPSSMTPTPTTGARTDPAPSSTAVASSSVAPVLTPAPSVPPAPPTPGTLPATGGGGALPVAALGMAFVVLGGVLLGRARLRIAPGTGRSARNEA